MKFLVNIRLVCITVFLVIGVGTTFTACTKADNTYNNISDMPDDEENNTTLAEDRACSAVSDPCSNSTNNSNCVLFVRCKLPTLPFGLTTYAQKLAIVNTQTAAAGRAAIINVTGSQYGHIAFVKSVNGTQITIRETNWCGQYVNERTGTKAGLKIAGYWKP